jgi:hypothetical protein
VASLRARALSITRGLFSLIVSVSGMYECVRGVSVHTGRADEYDRHVDRVTKCGHLRVVCVQIVERLFVVECEHKHDSVDPVCELLFGRAALVADQKQIADAVDNDFFLESPTCI